jgi:glycosyltransferase involved in cell wall biosynthesis
MTKVAKGYEIVILYAGGQYYLMAAITAKFLRKKLVLVNFGSYIKQANKSIFYRILAINEILITRLSDRVVFESPRVIDSYGLGKYEEKNRVADHRFLNTNVFSITKALNNRERKIGYFGRILKGKGVLEFARSLPLVIKQNTHVSFDIIGGGDFIDDVKHEVERNGSLSKVTFTGYINQEDVPKLLNELTVLVFPSPLDGWEGLPTVILEAMACGTPVLATPTGGVLDVIEDGITGFIMEDNSPECIAKNIVRVLNCASLGDIVKRARDFIEQNYNFETTVANYRKILLDL